MSSISPFDVPERGRATTLPRSLVVAYGAPGALAALPVIPVAVLLPAWYARDLGVGLMVTGVALGVARLLDFASDLLIGLLVDRSHWRGYRYKPVILAGAIVAGAGLLALALPPNDVHWTWLAGGSVVMFTGWTLMMVPYTAMGAELAAGYHDRSRLTASREVAGLVGMLVALSTPLIAAQFALELAPLTAVATVAMLLGIPLLATFAHRVPEPDIRSDAPSIAWSDLAGLLGNRAFRDTLAGWCLNGFANGLPAVLFPLVVGDYFRLSETATFLLLACYFGAAVVATPAWLACARRHGKIATWRLSAALNALVFAPVLLLDASSAAWFFVICIASGVTLGADLALPPSIQADILGDDRRASGLRRTASAFALWSMATKLALALAVFVAFVTLGGRYDEGDGASANLLLLYVAVPVAAKLALVAWLARLPETSLRGGNPAAYD